MKTLSVKGAARRIWRWPTRSRTTDMKTLSVKGVIEQLASVARGYMQRVVRALPRYHYQVGHKPGSWSIEYWPGDDQWRHSIHLNWNWKGRRRWLCVSLPEVP